MHSDYINIALAFLEGLALIVSPCILPILPIILSGSIEGSRKRPYGIIVGFVIIFSLFTFFSRSIVLHTGIDLTIIRYVSYGLLFVFGIVMLSTYLTEQFTLATQKLTTVGSSISTVNNSQGGFLSGLLFGGLVGVIWTPCAGPILAAVIVQSVLQQTTFNSFLTIVAFGMGAAVPMLLIALFGRNIMNRFQFLKTHSYRLRRILGVIIILSVAFMIYSEGAAGSLTKSNPETVPTKLIDGLYTPYAAPNFSKITAWINSPPLTMEQLKGKVVLIDFWAYSCINCIRTLPYIKDWYQKYHDKGFVVIGVHSPEFEFERVYSNVKNAVEKSGIQYPVALDNDFATWRNFQNQYWPAHYLIDKNGMVVYTHFGEGNYDITENNIRFLLGVTGTDSKMREEVSYAQSPETYLGYSRAKDFVSPEAVVPNQSSQYTFPPSLSKNQWALNGAWNIGQEKITSTHAGAAIKIKFSAKNVFIVMGNASSQPILVKLLLNGEVVENEKGKDVVNSAVLVKGHQLYNVISLAHPSEGVLQVIATAPGLDVYTFTFG